MRDGTLTFVSTLSLYLWFLVFPSRLLVSVMVPVRLSNVEYYFLDLGTYKSQHNMTEVAAIGLQLRKSVAEKILL